MKRISSYVHFHLHQPYITIHTSQYFSWKHAHMPSLHVHSISYHLTLPFAVFIYTWCQLLSYLYYGKLPKHMLRWVSGSVLAYNWTKWHIAARISMGLHENRRLVWVLSLRTISGKCKTWEFMPFFCVWIVIASAIIANHCSTTYSSFICYHRLNCKLSKIFQYYNHFSPHFFTVYLGLLWAVWKLFNFKICYTDFK